MHRAFVYETTMQHSALYESYMHSKEWRQRRFAKLEQAGNHCQYCGEIDGLQVHHLTYTHLGNEQSNELVALCTAHHWVADEIRKTGNKELLDRINKPFHKVKHKKEKYQMNRRELKLLRRKQKHERKLLDKTIHRDNRRPKDGNITRPLVAKGNRTIFISGQDGGRWVIADDITTGMANADGHR